MDYAQIVITFIGGLALFILGMQQMANGLQKAAGMRMKKLLEILTNNRFMGVLVGAFVTAIIQSSSATTVMVVGFVNAGLMNLTQAVGVIMGANIGTTMTGWLVSSVEWAEYLQPAKLAPIAVAVGVVMTFVKKGTMSKIAEIIIGFGVLFIGIEMMSGGVAPLRQSPFFQDLFVTLGVNPFLGILAGAVVTGVIQSSSASVGILQSLAAVGLVPWNAAIYIIMGQNIGTCVTALLSGIGATKNAKSAAYIHLLFNIIGTLIFSVMAIIFFKFINPALGAEFINRTEISFVHTLFNLSSTIMLFPFSGVLIFLATKISHGKNTPDDESALAHLDDRILETPGFAVQNSIKEVVRMGYIVLDNLNDTASALIEQDEDKIEKVLKKEQVIDNLNAAITQYLVKICNLQINEEENRIITSLFHTVNDIERVGDHCENIAELAQFIVIEKPPFSEIGIKELKEIFKLSIDCYETSIKSLEALDRNLAKKTLRQEQSVDSLEMTLRSSHIQRLSSNLCDPKAGVVFLDTITNLERIADHAKNIAEIVESQFQHKKKTVKS